MQNKNFERYAQIKRDMKALEEEETLLKKAILKDLDDNQTAKVAFDFGSFTKAIRTSYKYSEKVQAISERLKIAQVREQEKGIAKVVESPYLTFTAPKKKK